ncbi:MAG: chemotaxis protein CheC [Oscillospiraceae bacterium]|nr:chemotaxis protein CheC [Oscillospiraceae bacterium]
MDEKFSLDSLNDMERDLLGEVGNIGMGRVATAMSDMLSKTVGISVPVVNIVDLCELSDTLGMAEKRVAGILFGLSNDIDGMIMFVMEERFAKEVITVITGDDSADLSSLNEINTSLLQEIANIMAGSYLGAISELADFTIDMSVPYLAVDMLGAIMNIPAVEFGEIGDKVLLIEEQIIGNDSNFDSYLVLIPTPESLKKLLNKVGGIYGINC